MNKNTKGSWHSLLIQDLSLQIKLGCLQEERSSPQEVRINLEFRFPKPPIAVQSDNLEDTVCYAKISSALQSYCEDKEFKLIEKLAHDLKYVVENIVGNDLAISLTVHKVKPPVQNLLGGTFYRIADFP